MTRTLLDATSTKRRHNPPAMYRLVLGGLRMAPLGIGTDVVHQTLGASALKASTTDRPQPSQGVLVTQVRI